MKKIYLIVAILCGTYLSKTFGMEQQISVEEKQKRNGEITSIMIRSAMHSILRQQDTTAAPAVIKQEREADITSIMIRSSMHSILHGEEKEQNISNLENK